MDQPQEPLASLLDYSKQAIQVGNPPVYLYSLRGQKLSNELVMISAQLRIAEALERLADAQDVTVQRDELAESAAIYGGGQRNG